jgi:protocatechuate 3,4-dioxygenase beta subunit
VARLFLGLLLLLACVVGWLLWGGSDRIARRERADVAVERQPEDRHARTGESSSSESSGSVRPGGIEPRILHDEDGNPVEGANIDIRQGGVWIPAMQTDHNGQVQLMIAMTFDLSQPSVRRDNALRIRHPRLQIWQPHSWEAGEPLRVPSGLPFSVRVRDGAGNAVEGADVSVECVHFWREGDLRENRDELGRQRARSDAEGVAQFAGMPPGGVEVDVEVVHDLYSVFRAGWEFEQLVPPAIQVTLRDGATIAGRVVDPRGNGVTGAVVWVGPKHAVCDARGYYEMFGVPNGASPIASKPGVGAGAYGVTGPQVPYASSLKVASGTRKEGVDITLWPVSRIFGTVRASEGQAIDAPRYEVGIYLPGIPEGLKGPVGESGRFESREFFVLSKTAIKVQVHSNSHGSATRTVDVSPGQDADLGDIRLVTMGTVAGRVVDGDDSPVAGGYVEIANVRALVDKEGRFVVAGVPPGKWAVARYEGRTRPEAVSAPALVEAGRRVDDVRVVVGLLGVIEGIAKDKDGQPYSGVQVAAVPPGMPPKIDIRKWGSYKTGEDGRFRIDGLAPARYRVAVVNTNDSIFTGFEIADRMEPVEVDLAGGTAEVELVLERHGRIKVVVKSATGDELESVTVTLRSLRSPVPTAAGRFWQSEDPVQTWLGMGDAFHANLGVENDGQYMVTVEAPKHAPWRSNVMKLLSGAEVDLGTVSLGKGRRVVVEVSEPGGDPAVGTRVRLLDRREQRVDRSDPAVTDAKGRLVLEHSPEGDVFVLMEHGAGAPAIARLPERGAANVRMRLVDGRPLTVRVQDEYDGPRPALVALIDPATGLFLGDKPTDRKGVAGWWEAPKGRLQLLVRTFDDMKTSVIEVTDEEEILFRKAPESRR